MSGRNGNEPVSIGTSLEIEGSFLPETSQRQSSRRTSRGPGSEEDESEGVRDAEGQAGSGEEEREGGRNVEEVPEEETALLGWRKKSTSVSLESANASIKVPDLAAAWYKQWAAYIGVGFMVSVG